MTEQDWRWHRQDRYLTAARLRYTPYRAPSERWDHDHCDFCTLKLSDRVDSDAARAGWQTEDGYHWVCDECFTDFRERLGFLVIHEGAPTRAVELRDARVLEVTRSEELVTVALQAFVLDDWTSEARKGCSQRIDLTFDDAEFERHGSGEPRILDGSVRVDDQFSDNKLPIPFHEKGAVIATMSGADFELTVRARGVWLRVVGAPGASEG